MKKTIEGPDGVKLHLDTSEIFESDPGNGTPALVEYKGCWGTYWCCADTMDCGGIDVTKPIIDWLNSEEIQNEVEKLYL